MGTGSSKPDYVSEENWEEIMQRREQIRVEREKTKTLEKTKHEERIQMHKQRRREDVEELAVAAAEFQTKCYDTPKILMLLPHRRMECQYARADFFARAAVTVDTVDSVAVELYD